MKGLIIKDPWITLILDKRKPWEIRGSDTKHRGITHLIKSGAGLVIGSAVLIGTRKLTSQELKDNFFKHRIEDLSMIQYKNIWAWIFGDAAFYAKPISYTHPQGAVIWVNLGDVIT